MDESSTYFGTYNTSIIFQLNADSCRWMLAYYENLYDVNPFVVPTLLPSASISFDNSTNSTNSTNVTCSCIDFEFYNMFGTTWDTVISREAPAGLVETVHVDSSFYRDQMCSKSSGLYYMTVVASGEQVSQMNVSRA